MRNLFLSGFLMGMVLFCGGQSQAQGIAGAEPAVKIIKLNFASVSETLNLLNAIKSSDGKVAANEEARTVVLMDTPDKIKAMESLLRQVDVQTVTVSVVLKFSKPGEILDKVRPLLTQSVGMISIDNGAGKIIVTDTPAVVEKVRRAVEQLDAHGRRIIVEAKLVQVALDDEHVNGVDWSGIVEDHQSFHLDGRYPFLSGVETGETLSFGAISNEDFVPLIDALDTVGEVKEFPVTFVPVMSNDEVRMVVHFEPSGVRLEAIDPDNKETAYTSGISGLEFILKPQVDVDETLKMGISAVQQSAGTAKAAELPALLTRNLRGVTVRAADGGSIVLGGLIATGKVLVQRKVPLMGDLPLLGFAFRYHNRSIHREEYVVLITLKMAGSEPAVAYNDKVDGFKIK